MGASPSFRKLPDYAARIIRFKARKLIGKYGFGPADQGDIEQELTLFLWRRLGVYDPTRGPLKAFIDHVIKHGIATLVEHQRAQKRDYQRKPRSLNAPVRSTEPESPERSALMDENDGARRLGRCRRDSTMLSDLALDVRERVARLSPELRELCELLRHASITEVAEKTGMPRGTLYERVNVLRRLFEDAGLRSYLDE